MAQDGVRIRWGVQDHAGVRGWLPEACAPPKCHVREALGRHLPEPRGQTRTHTSPPTLAPRRDSPYNFSRLDRPSREPGLEFSERGWGVLYLPTRGTAVVVVVGKVAATRAWASVGCGDAATGRREGGLPPGSWSHLLGGARRVWRS